MKNNQNAALELQLKLYLEDLKADIKKIAMPVIQQEIANTATKGMVQAPKSGKHPRGHNIPYKQTGNLHDSLKYKSDKDAIRKIKSFKKKIRSELGTKASSESGFYYPFRLETMTRFAVLSYAARRSESFIYKIMKSTVNSTKLRRIIRTTSGVY